MDLNIHSSVKGKQVAHNGSALDEADRTTVVNNIHSLFSQWCFSTDSRSRPSRIYTTMGCITKIYSLYGHDASETHLTNSFWFPNDGNFQTHNPPADSTNRGYRSRWKRTNKSSEAEMHGRVHGDLFNVCLIRLPGAQLQIKFTKSKSDLYVLSFKGDTGASFKFLDATLHVRRAETCRQSGWCTPKLGDD